MKLPKSNGRPQLWLTEYSYGGDRLRIVYPSGRVEWFGNYKWQTAAFTSRSTPAEALKAIKNYDRSYLMLGYLGTVVRRSFIDYL